jgi:transposase-like protein
MTAPIKGWHDSRQGARPRQYLMLYDDADWLRACIDGGLTQREIAAEVGCHVMQINRALRRHGIAVNSRPARYKKLDDRAWLVDQYVTQQRSSRAIAEEVGCGVSAVLGAVHKHAIQPRQRGQHAPPRLPEPEPPPPMIEHPDGLVKVRLNLAALRDAGWEFDPAWVLATADANGDAGILASTRAAWQRAYDGEPDPIQELKLPDDLRVLA